MTTTKQTYRAPLTDIVTFALTLPVAISITKQQSDDDYEVTDEELILTKQRAEGQDAQADGQAGGWDGGLW